MPAWQPTPSDTDTENLPLPPSPQFSAFLSLYLPATWHTSQKLAAAKRRSNWTIKNESNFKYFNSPSLWGQKFIEIHKDFLFHIYNASKYFLCNFNMRENYSGE